MEELTARMTSFIVPLLPGLAIGYLLGRLARKAFSAALLIVLGMAGLVLALAMFGAAVSFIRCWLETGSTWAGDKLSGAGQYLAALLPLFAALGVGFKIGLAKGKS